MRILIADAHALFRDGLRSLLESREGLEVVGEASNGADVVSQARQLRPDLVLLDLNMPDADGRSAIRSISELAGVQVVVLTGSTEESDLFEALEAGASGYLTKSLTAVRLFALLEHVERGELVLTPQLACKVLRGPRPRETVKSSSDHPDALTNRELEVLKAMAEGVTTNLALGRHLALSENTIKFHVSNIFDKLHLHDRAQVVGHALRSGLVTPSSTKSARRV